MLNRRSAFALSLIAAALICLPSHAQRAKDFKPASDSLKVLLKERFGVRSYISLKSVRAHGGALDLRFDRTLSDYPWKKEDIKWFKEQIERLSPWPGKKIGAISCLSIPIGSLATPEITNDGTAQEYRYSQGNGPAFRSQFITRVGEPVYSKGLSGKGIALWQSHGRYYNEKMDRWIWQRSMVHRTVEDLYTQSYVLPFLIPMLERAGAYVMTPRERDTQLYEVICDNDASWNRSAHTATKCTWESPVRALGSYAESGKWADCDSAGFADTKAFYTRDDNPFTMGTARKAVCVKGSKATASAVWTPNISKRGHYAVYVSYRSESNSTQCAHYTVEHMGGKSEFIVDQTKGGSIWVYLGTFEFEQGSEGKVTLDNSTPAGCELRSGAVVTADAVRFGGGMGKIARGPKDEPDSLWRTSLMPAYCEGAMYSMQWSGLPTSVYRNWPEEYTNDYASRGAWVKDMKGRRGIPVDLSLGFHTDAGLTPNDSIVGTLSIYTLMAEGSREMTDGTDRMTCRLLAEWVQTQICTDLRAEFNPKWTRRQLWDRSYSESRTTDVPGMLLELLSHQNFGDMKLGLDPAFRFTASRAVYKGMLKFLSTLYGTPYVVQPLPVNSLSVMTNGSRALVSWKPTEDALEPTAKAASYIVYTRKDDGGFDQGVRVKGCHAEFEMEAGHLYSFKVEAENDGGRSFPSEVLCAGIPAQTGRGDVLVVNNFDRISAPTWFDTPEYAGFNGREDSGVPYMEQLDYIGENYDFLRRSPWESDYAPGFGSSHSNYACTKVAGNTFDFAVVHARELLALGYGVQSASRSAFCAMADTLRSFVAADIICGKQVSTRIGAGNVPARYEVYPEDLQAAIKSFTRAKGSIIISGSYLATDVWGSVYPLEWHGADSLHRQNTRRFVQNTLGYKLSSSHPSLSGDVVRARRCKVEGLPEHLHFNQDYSQELYRVENPDALAPVPASGQVVLRYADSETSAAVFCGMGSYRVAAFGFPLEIVTDPMNLRALLGASLEYINQKQ